MKICVTAAGSGLDARVDPRFGRCQYFTIVDPDTMEFESTENASIAASGGAGIQSAQFIANQGVEFVLTGNVGPNASTTLQAAGIKVIIGVSGTVREAIEAYKNGKLQPPVAGPSVDAHFGMGGGGAGAPVSPGSGQAAGSGMGMGRSMGGGMGMGRARPAPGVSPPAGPIPPQSSRSEDLQELKEQSRILRSQLDQIMQKIDNLEKGEIPDSRNKTGISQVKEILKKEKDQS